MPNIFGKLRDIEYGELELMLSWRNAKNVRSNMYTRQKIRLNEHLAWWSDIQAKEDQKYFMYENDSEPLGIVAFTGIDQKNRNSFWAFYASPEATRGTGSKMEFLALDYAFKKIGLYKLNAEVFAFNTRVLKLHQKFGFKVEGVFRDQHLVEDSFVDIHRIGILATEWFAKREHMYTKLLAFS